MKNVILPLIVYCISLSSPAQENNPGCLDKTLPFFTPIEGFYLTDNCKYSEFDSYEFVIDRNTRSIKKEGVYREVWFRKKGDSDRHVSGTQILQNHVNAIKAAGGEVVKESDGSVFKINYNGKEIWIYVNSNTYSSDLDNYGIMSIETGTLNQEIGAQGTSGSTGTTGTQGQMSSGDFPLHMIGEQYGGGIVFYVYDNGLHGLIASSADQSTGIRWYGGSEAVTRAKANGIGAGKANTAIIISNQGFVDGAEFAASICNEYSFYVNGITYGDWYLPSKFELNLLYLQKTIVGNFADVVYWSSCEENSSNAWCQSFLSGIPGSSSKGRPSVHVRAIRSF